VEEEGRRSCRRARDGYGRGPSVIPGVVFPGSLDGHLRAYSTEDGKVLWDFDTVKGVRASGGGIDGPGAIVSGGTVYVGSGYAQTGGIGGNVLLAFGAE
jgi:polyvinyl alcohol dehydrogenase (cytochrome)